ncbi:MAG: hypothetical protein EZS28_053631, partial [Streblomastix strix]
MDYSSICTFTPVLIQASSPPAQKLEQVSNITPSPIMSLVFYPVISAKIPPPEPQAVHSVNLHYPSIVNIPPLYISAQIAPPTLFIQHLVNCELITEALPPLDSSMPIAPLKQFVNVQVLTIYSFVPMSTTIFVLLAPIQ